MVQGLTSSVGNIGCPRIGGMGCLRLGAASRKTAHAGEAGVDSGWAQESTPREVPTFLQGNIHGIR